MNAWFVLRTPCSVLVFQFVLHKRPSVYAHKESICLPLLWSDGDFDLCNAMYGLINSLKLETILIMWGITTNDFITNGRVGKLCERKDMAHWPNRASMLSCVYPHNHVRHNKRKNDSWGCISDRHSCIVGVLFLSQCPHKCKSDPHKRMSNPRCRTLCRLFSSQCPRRLCCPRRVYCYSKSDYCVYAVQSRKCMVHPWFFQGINRRLGGLSCQHPLVTSVRGVSTGGCWMSRHGCGHPNVRPLCFGIRLEFVEIGNNSSQ